MTITIHRGIDQIGGCITEIASAGGTKILIDFGHNLPSGDEPTVDKYEDDATLDDLLKGVDAVFYTHPHGDHVGFEAQVSKRGIPQYIGSVSKELMLLLKGHLAYTGNPKHQAELEAFEEFHAFVAKDSIPIGDITVTPYFVSHSAPDAYMFVVECDGKKVLHTGDFRDHGYRGKGLLPTINSYIVRRKIDVLITEGTMLTRGDSRLMTENELKYNAINLFHRHRNLFVMCSSMDADRLASFYQAAQATGKMFVVDGFQWKVLETIENTLGTHSSLYRFPARRYFAKHLEEIQNAVQKKGFVMMVRNNRNCREFIDSIYPTLKPKETCFLYSQFLGYILKEHSAFQQSTYDFVHSHDWHFEYLHTSGHASREALAAVCNAVNPRLAIIPIHREAGSDFRSLDLPQELKDKVHTESTTIEDVKIIIK
jgi:ribonuclease J